jgi:hypothetical protein
MSTPQPARPAGNRDRVARHARAGPEPVLSSIPQPPGPETGAAQAGAPQAGVPAPPSQPVEPIQPIQPHPPDGRIAKRAVRPWRYLLPVFAGGTAATVISAVRAFGWTIGARPAAGAGPWLAAAIAAGLGTAALSAVTCMYRDRQQTRRTEIEQRRAEILAAAFARALDATHARAQNLPAAKEMTEAARVRDSARQVTALLAPEMLATDLAPGVWASFQMAVPAVTQERRARAQPATIQPATMTPSGTGSV